MPKRINRMLTIFSRTKSLRLAVNAARAGATGPTLAFLDAGGLLGKTDARIFGQTLPLSQGTWRALPFLARFTRAGGCVEAVGAERYELQLSNGLRFQSSTDQLADVLGVLVERFVDDEYGYLDVRDAVVLDVGGHIGDSAAYFLHRGAGVVHMFEPFAELAEDARENLRRNGMLANVVVHTAALGPSSGAVTVIFNSRDRATNAVIDTPPPRHGKLREVRVMSFTDVLSQLRLANPDRRLICKMDCEGCERRIFASAEARAVLKQCDGCAIEFHPRVPDGFAGELRASGFAVQTHATEWGAEMLLAMRVSTK